MIDLSIPREFDGQGLEYLTPKNRDLFMKCAEEIEKVGKCMQKEGEILFCKRQHKIMSKCLDKNRVDNYNFP